MTTAFRSPSGIPFEQAPPVPAPPAPAPTPTPPTEPAPPPGDEDYDTGPSTLGSDDFGDTPAGVSTTTGQPDQLDNTAPENTQSNLDQLPSSEIPDEPPETTQQINRILRSVATWLSQALAALGPLFELDPRVRIILAVLEATLWLAEYLPKIFSYLDPPKTLEELQNAAARGSRLGYERHHIVEVLRNPENPESNAKRFPDQIDSRENLVRIPYWKHVEIGSWYSKPNKKYGRMSPRDFLRGKSWDEQYGVGIETLRDFGVLK